VSEPFQYFDLQVNGYAGVDFNQDDLAEADLRHACQRLREDGVDGVLATIITDQLPRMEARLRRIAAICRQDPFVRAVVRGIHLEGPFINPAFGYVGAHPAASVRPADVETAKRLLDAADGLVLLVTLAPERDPGMKLVRYLAERNTLVSAGHCDPSLDQLRAAIDAGLSVFTHLGNGCPVILRRHDNIIERALSLYDRLTLCFIADGIHIPPVALGNYLRLAGLERSIVVSDAIAAAGEGPGRYGLGSQTVDIADGQVPMAADGVHFAGSLATMPRMAALLRNDLGLADDEIRRLLCDNPRRLVEAHSMPVLG
jgi:N-acetylglucosamine-6-phosphate deacetylase